MGVYAESLQKLLEVLHRDISYVYTIYIIMSIVKRISVFLHIVKGYNIIQDPDDCGRTDRGHLF